jgi:hypothetical protein
LERLKLEENKNLESSKSSALEKFDVDKSSEN